MRRRFRQKTNEFNGRKRGTERKRAKIMKRSIRYKFPSSSNLENWNGSYNRGDKRGDEYAREPFERDYQSYMNLLERRLRMMVGTS
jgi:hypothetical protein